MNEDAFLGRIFGRMPAFGSEVVVPPGDDCAALDLGGGMLTLVASDQLVGGRHYHPDGDAAPDPGLCGRKLLARNLSDIAAMGGVPDYCLLNVAAANRDSVWLESFHAGILALGAEFGVVLVGGDLASTFADEVFSLTILGHVERECVKCRDGASPGDVLFVTGRFGQSLQTGHHLHFQPRCREGRWLAQNGFGTAMMDVSDGLGLDVERLCRKSRVDLFLDLASIPRRTETTTVEQALGDGEDYELLVAIAPGDCGELLGQWPFSTELTRVGEFRDGGGKVCDLHGEPIPVSGFDHFSNLD